MSDPIIPADVSEFIARYVDSIAHLEALLLLRRETAGEWDGPRLATRLYIPAAEAQRVLDQLAAAALVRREAGLYRYLPKSAGDEAVVERLSALYATHLIPITHLIHDRTGRRIQAFADAFKLKKGP